MNIEEYVREVIEKNLTQYQSNPLDLRLAINLAHSLDAMTARIFWENNKTHAAKTDDDLRTLYSSRDLNVKIVHDLACSLKHCKLTRRTNTRDITSANQIENRGAFDSEAFDNTAFDVTRLVVAKDDGTELDPNAVFEGALLFLKTEAGIP